MSAKWVFGEMKPFDPDKGSYTCSSNGAIRVVKRVPSVEEWEWVCEVTEEDLAFTQKILDKS